MDSARPVELVKMWRCVVLASTMISLGAAEPFAPGQAVAGALDADGHAVTSAASQNLPGVLRRPEYSNLERPATCQNAPSLEASSFAAGSIQHT